MAHITQKLNRRNITEVLPPTRSSESIVNFVIMQIGCIDVAAVTVHCRSLLPE